MKHVDSQPLCYAFHKLNRHITVCLDLYSFVFHFILSVPLNHYQSCLFVVVWPSPYSQLLALHTNSNSGSSEWNKQFTAFSHMSIYHWYQPIDPPTLLSDISWQRGQNSRKIKTIHHQETTDLSYNQERIDIKFQQQGTNSVAICSS